MNFLLISLFFLMNGCNSKYNYSKVDAPKEASEVDGKSPSGMSSRADDAKAIRSRALQLDDYLSPWKSGSLEEDLYFTLSQRCREEDGNVMIKGKCYPAIICIDLDGTVSLGGVGTSEKAYSLRFGQNEATISPPYNDPLREMKQRSNFDTNSPLEKEFLVISLPFYYHNQNYMHIFAPVFRLGFNYNPDYGIDWIGFNCSINTDVKVDIFGISKDRNSLPFESLPQYMSKIKARLSQNYEICSESIDWQQENEAYHIWYFFQLIQRSEKSEDQYPKFHFFKMWWSYLDDQLYTRLIELGAYDETDHGKHFESLNTFHY